MLNGETFPGVQCFMFDPSKFPVSNTHLTEYNQYNFLSQEQVKAPLFHTINTTGSSEYGYIANLCVAKSSRRQGIASNMLQFAVESAKSTGK